MIVGAEGQRFYVAKESGSEWARVIDRSTGRQIKRFNVLRGDGKRNGWNQADELCRRLNEQT